VLLSSNVQFQLVATPTPRYLVCACFASSVMRTAISRAAFGFRRRPES
jgi:hypothetical protein